MIDLDSTTANTLSVMKTAFSIVLNHRCEALHELRVYSDHTSFAISKNKNVVESRGEQISALQSEHIERRKSKPSALTTLWVNFFLGRCFVHEISGWYAKPRSHQAIFHVDCIHCQWSFSEGAGGWDRNGAVDVFSHLKRNSVRVVAFFEEVSHRSGFVSCDRLQPVIC